MATRSAWRRRLKPGSRPPPRPTGVFRPHVNSLSPPPQAAPAGAGPRQLAWAGRATRTSSPSPRPGARAAPRSGGRRPRPTRRRRRPGSRTPRPLSGAGRGPTRARTRASAASERAVAAVTPDDEHDDAWASPRPRTDSLPRTPTRRKAAFSSQTTAFAKRRRRVSFSLKTFDASDVTDLVARMQPPASPPRVPFWRANLEE
jgi:hypothetical protein